MSAQEIIEQIKALPPQEKAVVADFEVSYIDERTVEANAQKIFDRYDAVFKNWQSERA